MDLFWILFFFIFQSHFDKKYLPKMQQSLLLHSALVLPDKSCLIFRCLLRMWLFLTFEAFTLLIPKIFSRLWSLECLKNCPCKICFIDFIFRQQKMLLTTVRLNSGHYATKYYYEFGNSGLSVLTFCETKLF